MRKEKAIELIHKYFHEDGLTETELKQLLEWLEHPENTKILDGQLELDYSFRNEKEDFDAIEAYQNIKKHLEKRNRGGWKGFELLKCAALLVLLFGIGIYFFTLDTKNSVDYKSNYVTLKLKEGTVRILHDEGQGVVLDKQGKKIGVHDGNTLSYERDTMGRELVYNTLYVPRGKTFRLRLSDGTKIILNADTEIVYPINILPLQERHIQLRGEAYFQVAKDSLRPFIAKTNNQEVRVYGTTFNIKSYPEDLYEETVLVEGSVGVNTGESGVKLAPGEMASTKGREELKVKNVEVNRYIAWIQNRLEFQSNRFDEIIKILERKFDVEIKNTYEELNAERFTARFDDQKGLDQILELFAESRSFNFERNGNRLTIYEPMP